MRKLKDEDIFPAKKGLETLKYGSYNNTAYALAEIIDNSYEAGAENIHVCLICTGNSLKPSVIAVLDSGRGMEPEELQESVKNGLGKGPPKAPFERALGRFGVGLIKATFSQCSSLEIMSWQKKMVGKKAPFIKIDKEGEPLIDEGEKEIPDVIWDAFSDFPGGSLDGLESGTIVLWRSLYYDKLSHKKATTLKKHLAERCGPVYQNFIRNKEVRILISCKYENRDDENEYVSAIDPTFLHYWDDSRLAPFKNKDTMFRLYTGVDDDEGKNQDGSYKAEVVKCRDPDTNKVIGEVRILASFRRPVLVINAAKDLGHEDPGKAPFGKLADELKGVSILRAGREIKRDPKWLRTDRTVDRWVSVSVDFDPSLDEIFGVSNDKQDAKKLSELAGTPLNDLKSALNDLKSTEDDEDRDNYDAIALYMVAIKISTYLKEMQKIVGKERRGIRKPPSPDDDFETNDDPSKPGIVELRGLSRSVSDRKSNITPKNPNNVEKDLEKAYDKTISGNEPAKETRPKIVVDNNLEFDMVRDPTAKDSAMFKWTIGGVNTLIVALNEQHPFISRLKKPNMDFSKSDALDDDEEAPEDLSYEDKLVTLEDQLEYARKTIRAMFFAFARAEMEAHGSVMQEPFEDCRIAWSRVAKDMSDYDDNEE